VLRVMDAGPGIADDVADRLFKDRVDAGRGLGLGLFLTDAMMEAQGGSVQLEQRRPEAIFTLRWKSAPTGPAGKGQAAAPGVEEQDEAESDGKADETAGDQTQDAENTARSEAASRT